ncbi:hypothetical protein [Rhizobium phage RHph_X2_26]|nr:hypothetical protein [Rhizobium phage RHph_X2_26]
MQKIEAGKEIVVRLGYATAHCAIGVTLINGRISNVSEKAVEIATYTAKDKRVTFWLPLAALKQYENKHDVTGAVWFELRKWFRPSGWTKTAMEISCHSGFIAA